MHPKHLLKQESAAGNLLEVNLLADNKSIISFPATLPFDQIQLQQVGTLAIDVLSDLNIYFGFGIEQQAFRDQNPRQSTFDSAAGNVWVNGTNSLVCLTARIGRVAGQGTSTTARQYTFLDSEAVAQSTNVVYYRLRQVDLDSKESLSPVVAVTFQGELLSMSLQLAPYPASSNGIGRVQIGPFTVGQRLLVYDMQGPLVNHSVLRRAKAKKCCRNYFI